MAIAFDAASDTEHYGAAKSWSHTVGSLYNRLLLVAVSISGVAQTVSSITFGSQSLTFLAAKTRSTSIRLEFWYLKKPAAGTANITVNMSAGARCTFGAASWSGVHQIDTFGTVASASSYSSAISVDVTSESGEVVIDACGWDEDKSATVGADQTERWNRLGTPGGLDVGCAGSNEDGAATVTMSWSLGGNASWATIGVPLKPAPPRITRRPGMGFVYIEDEDRLTGLRRNNIL